MVKFQRRSGWPGLRFGLCLSLWLGCCLTTTVVTQPLWAADKDDVNLQDETHPVRSVVFDRLLFAGGQGVIGTVYAYEVYLNRVDFFAEGHSVWHFTAWNKTDGIQVDKIDKADTYITDQEGNKYLVDNISVGWKNEGGRLQATLNTAVGEKRTFDLYFPNPKPEARVFRLNITSPMSFSAVYLLIPPAPLADKAPEAEVPVERFDTVETEIARPEGKDWTLVREVDDVAGIRTPYLIALEKIQWLKTGDLRVHLSCWHTSDRGVLDRFAIQPTKPLSMLINENGQAFPLVSSSLGQTLEEIAVNCAAGEKKSFWLEFRGPVPAGKRFLLRLGSPMRLPDMFVSLP